jgi:hypothetical protein
MIGKEKENDRLRLLFGRMKMEELPGSFREEMMGRIFREAARRKRRNERLGLAAVIAASVAFMGLAAGALLYAGVPRVEWRMPELETLPFYLHIGALSLLLLGMDFFIRRAYRKRQERRGQVI